MVKDKNYFLKALRILIKKKTIKIKTEKINKERKIIVCFFNLFI